jgi:anti-anti-sigma regulatory factor
VLRIFITDTSAGFVMLQLDGRISGRWVELLQRTCEVPLRKSTRISIDLKNVSFSDRDGIALLRNLKERGFELLNPSPFIAGQIGSSSQSANGG